MFQGIRRGEDTGTMNQSHKITSQIVVGRSRVGKYIGSWRFGFNGIYKVSFKEIIILEMEPKGGIQIIWSGFEDHRKKVCEGNGRQFKLTGRNKVFSSGRGC